MMTIPVLPWLVRHSTESDESAGLDRLWPPDRSGHRQQTHDHEHGKSAERHHIPVFRRAKGRWPVFCQRGVEVAGIEPRLLRLSQHGTQRGRTAERGEAIRRNEPVQPADIGAVAHREQEGDADGSTGLLGGRGDT
jgi:hypothetical protein